MSYYGEGDSVVAVHFMASEAEDRKELEEKAETSE